MGTTNWTTRLEALTPDVFGFGHPIHRIMLYGAPGSGKSSWGVRWAEHYKRPCERVVIDRSVCQDDLLVGQSLRVRDGAPESAWTTGAATRMMQAGGILILDEIDLASPDLRGALHAICDDQQICRISLKSGETVVPSKGFAVVMTSNKSPEFLAPAMRDRIDIPVCANDPAEGIFNSLPDDYAEYLKNSGIADAVTAWYPLVSARRMLALYKLSRALGENVAAELLFGETNAAALLTGINTLRNSK